MNNNNNYITLKELVELSEIQFGQILIPISAFGYTYEKLQKIMIEALRTFEQYYPYEKELKTTLSSSGTLIEDAIEIINIRYSNGSFKEIAPKMAKNLYKFYDNEKMLKSDVNVNGLITYLAHYPVGYFDITKSLSSLYSTETDVDFETLGHFKKGTLKIELDKGFIPESVVLFDNTTNILNININTGSKLSTGSIVKLKTLNTLPLVFNSTTEYYCIKISDTQFKLANTKENALLNTEIDFNDNGIGTHYIYNIKDYIIEDLATYNTLTSNFNAVNSIFEIDNLIIKQFTQGDKITILSSTLAGLVVNSIHYVIILDETHIALASNFTDAILGISETFIGTGTGSIEFSLKDILASERVIQLKGPLGKADLSLDTLTGTFYNIYSLSGNLTITYASKYLAIQGLGVDYSYNDFFTLIFKQKFLNGIGRQKSTINIDGLPNNITADDLISAQADIAQQVKEYTETRGSWWKFA